MRGKWRWVIAAGLIWYLVSNPTGAANLVKSGMAGLGNVGGSLSIFVNKLGQ